MRRTVLGGMVALLAAAGSGCGGSLLPAGGTKTVGTVEVTPLSLHRRRRLPAHLDARPG